MFPRVSSYHQSTAKPCVTLVVLEHGYNTSQNTSLSTKDWARLVCSLTTATGHGLHKTSLSAPESTLEKVRAEMANDAPIDLKYPTLFHRLAAMAAHLEHFISPDLDDYQDWYFSLRLKTEQKLAKLATAELEDKWCEWKVEQINCCIAAHEAEIENAVRNRFAPYFMSAAMSLGLNITFEGPFNTPLPAPVASKKHTVSAQHQPQAPPH
jgi:hypothetical protein